MMKSTEVLNPRRSAFDGRRHVCTHKLTSSHELVYYTVGIRIIYLMHISLYFVWNSAKYQTSFKGDTGKNKLCIYEIFATKGMELHPIGLEDEAHYH